MARKILALGLLLVANVVTTIVAANEGGGDFAFVAWGLLAAQVGLVAMWCTLGPGGFWWRIGGASLLFLILTVETARLVRCHLPREYALAWAACSMIQIVFSLVLGVALNRARGSLCWSDAPARALPTQFTIRHLLLWMFGVAVVIGLGRMSVEMFAEQLRFLQEIPLIYATNATIAPLIALAMFQSTWIRKIAVLGGAWVALLLITYAETSALTLIVGGGDPSGIQFMNTVQVVWLTLAFGLAALAGVRCSTGEHVKRS